MKYNIIANNCVGASIYNELKEQFNNPFMWGFIDADNFITLMKEYDNINFNNYKIIPSTLDDEYKDSYSVIIDNKVIYHYIHYIHNDNYETPIKREELTGKHSRDILGNHMDTYTANKYEIRKNRMLQQHIEPIFYASISKYSPRKRIYDIINTPCKYKLVVLVPTNFDIDKNTIPNNVELIYNIEHAKWTNEKAKYTLNNSKIIHK